MRLQAHQPIGERVEAAVDQRLQREEFARRLAHLAAAIDQEIVVHPDPRAAVGAAAIGLVLRDLIGMVDFAVVDAAGMDVERMPQMLEAHHRTFEMPARRAAAPGRIPFHLPLLARRRGAPDREIGGVALARDGVDPALARLGRGSCQRAVMRHAAGVEIKPALDLVAILLDAAGEVDHLGNVIGRDGPFAHGGDVQPGDVGLEGFGVMRGNVPDRAGFACGGGLHLVVAGIGVARQMADIGDVDDVLGRPPLPPDHAAKRVGEQEGAHIADMLVIIDGGPAAIDAHLRRIDRFEALGRAGKAVIEHQRLGHGANRIARRGFGRKPARAALHLPRTAGKGRPLRREPGLRRRFSIDRRLSVLCKSSCAITTSIRRCGP